MRTTLFTALAAGAMGLASAQSVQNIVLYPDGAGDVGSGGAASNTRKVLMVDIDGDSDLDLISGHWGVPLEIHVNDGSGSFTLDTDPDGESLHDAFSPLLKGLAAYDWDNDGDLDLAIARGASGGQLTNLKLVNNTVAADDPDFGILNGLSFGTESEHSYDIAFVAAPGAPTDGGFGTIAVVANRGAQNRLYRHLGLNVWQEDLDDGLVNGPVLNSRDLLVADFTGDGSEDVFVSNAGNGGQANQLFANNALGDFSDVSDASITAVPGNSYGAAAGDLDNDGDADLVVANRAGFTTGEANFLVENTSTGGVWSGAFVTGNAITDDADTSYDVAIGDLDGDGDLDVAVANNAQNNAVYMNNLADDDGVTTANWFSNAGATTKVVHGMIQADRGLTKSVTLGEVSDYSGDSAHQGVEVALANGGTQQGPFSVNFYYRSFGRMFADLGGASTTTTLPRLSGDGFVSPSSDAFLFVEGAEPSALFQLFGTLSPTAVPFNGGTNFVNDQVLPLVAGAADGLGNIDVDVPAGSVPSVLEGVPIVFQVFTDDQALGADQAMSNGLSVVLQN